MGLLSLEKYLYAGRPQPEPAAVGSAPASYLDFATRALSSIRRSVLVGESLADLSENAEVIRRTLQVESEQQVVSQCAAELEAMLEIFQQRVRTEARQQASDLRNVLDILNETFSHLHTGTEKSAERLKELETGLSRAASIEDMPRLRNHLLKMLDYVRQEGTRDQNETRATLENLTQQIRHANATTSRLCTQLPGRNEALEYIGAELPRAGDNLYAGLFAADSLRAIRVRHGEELGARILQDAAQKHIAPLAADGRVFCWSVNSVLLMWRQTDPSVAPADLPSKLGATLQLRAFLGTRVATFSLALRSVVMQASGSVDEFVWTLDRFAKAGPGC